MGIYIHDAYVETILENKMAEYAEKHGEYIHFNGTHSLIDFHAENDDDCIYLTLDFQDDYKTPLFLVTRIMDEDLEIHETFESAWQDFEERIKEFSE